MFRRAADARGAATDHHPLPEIRREFALESRCIPPVRTDRTIAPARSTEFRRPGPNPLSGPKETGRPDECLSVIPERFQPEFTATRSPRAVASLSIPPSGDLGKFVSLFRASSLWKFSWIRSLETEQAEASRLILTLDLASDRTEPVDNRRYELFFSADSTSPGPKGTQEKRRSIEKTA